MAGHVVDEFNLCRAYADNNSSTIVHKTGTISRLHEGARWGWALFNVTANITLLPHCNPLQTKQVAEEIPLIQ